MSAQHSARGDRFLAIFRNRLFLGDFQKSVFSDRFSSIRFILSDVNLLSPLFLGLYAVSQFL
jgi:hypothetical protein